MEFSRSEYPALLDSLQPSQAVTVLQERIKRVDRVNIEIADWLQERRKVEEAYVAGLKKLVRKQPPDESSELGIFSGPWAKIVSSAETIARSHHTLARGIEVDIEQPLREFASKNREMQAMSTIQGNLTAMAKEVDAANEKVEKLKKKGGKASAGKVSSATTDVENATSQWVSQAPFIYEKFQHVDESRLNHLRDILTQFQTHEADQIERNRATAEEVLNELLNVDTAVEIKSFANRTLHGRPKLERQRSRNFQPQSATQPASLAPTTTTPATDDAASQISGTSGGAQKTTQESRHGGLGGGLKRLGTKISRRRNSTVPYGRTPSPSKHSTDRFNPFGRSSRDAGSSSSPRNSAAHVPTSSSIIEEDQPSRADETPSSPTEGRGKSRDLPNGSGPLAKLSPTDGPNGTEMRELPQVQSGPPIMINDERRDGEGFNIPAARNDPISQAEQEAAQLENQQPQFKLDIRNDPIQEEDADAETALANVANTLRAQAAPTRKTGTIRGRRDVRNTVFIPSAQSPESVFGETPSLQSLQKLSRPAVLAAEDHIGSDTQSVRSSHSLSTISSTIIRHPELHEPGLNSSVVETVSSWLENGQVTKAVVIGELALAYNPPNSQSLSTTESIRLENFIALEKVAPNPSFVTQTPNQSGEYSLNLSQISKTTVAFKYQLHLNDNNLRSFAPIILNPAWKIEPNQTSVILSYSLNPEFGTPPRKSIKLRDVTIIIHLEGSKALSCQSKPVGTFSKERSVIYWKLGEVELSDSAPTKLLARFATENEGKAGAVEARWEISGENAKDLGSGLNVSLARPTSAVGNQPSDADPFADERATPSPGLAWKEVPCSRKITSGRYTVA